MYYKTKFQSSFFYVLAVLFLTFSLCNCSDNKIDTSDAEITKLNEQNQRINFANYEGFSEKVNELSNLDNYELKSWIQKNNPNSLYNHLKDNSTSSDYLEDLPDAYKAIFNDDSEVVISDKIIWLSDEKLYEFNVSDNVELLKNQVGELKQIGSIKIIFSDQKVDSDNSLSSRVSIGQNQLDARYQHEFTGSYYYDCNGTYISNNARFKYVHELMTVQTVIGTAGDSKLYLRVKLEWRGRRRWKPASEPRDMTININLSGTYLTFNNGNTITTFGTDSVNLNYTCTGDKTILLKYSDSYGLEGGAPYWSVQSSGTIFHKLHRAPYSWNNSFWY